MGQGNSQETSVNLDGTAWAETPALFRMVVDRIPGVLWAVDSELRFTASFGAALRDLNLLPNQVVGKTLYEYFATTDESFPGIASHRRALQGEASDFDIRWMQRLFQVHVEPLRDGRGQIAGCVGYARDTTEHQRLIDSQLQYQIAFRRQAESQQAIFQRLVEEAGQIFLVAGRDHRITYVNDFGCQLLGKKRDDIVGASLLGFYVGEDRQRLEHEILPRVLADGKWTGELSLATEAGVRIAAWQHVFLVHDTEADTQRFATVIADITGLRVAQETLNREQESLWHMLRSSDQERQMIAYEIHDGLAQQLAGALLQFQSYEYQRELHPDRARETFAAGMAALRQAHLEARRLISGVRPPILDEYGIDAALAVLANEKSLTATARIIYESEVEFGRLPPILENIIYRIAQEALTNACKHSGSPEVRMCLVQDGDTVRLEVCDAGIGFNPEAVVEHRFGLQSIRVRTRMLGGQLTIDSAEGQGTMIRVVLPFVEREMLPKGPP